MTSASSVSFFVDSARETLRARGPDAVSWLNGLVSADLRGVAPGRGAYALLLTKTGKIRTDPDVLATRDGLLIGVAQGTGDAVRELLGAHLVMEDVELERAPGVVWVRLIGEGAARLSEALSEQALAHGAIDWLGTGNGAALALEEGALARLAELDPGAVALDSEGWRLLRLRHGFPEFGADYGSDDNPHEAALDRRAVSWDKGCYLGQEVVCMQDLRGKVKRRLAVLEIAGTEPPAPDSPVAVEGSDEPVGVIRSAVVRDATGTGGTGAAPTVLAFARLKAPHFDPHVEGDAPTRFSVQGRAARIVALPLP